jgi:hypothetical protein
MTTQRPARIGVIGDAVLNDAGEVAGAAHLAALISYAGAETAFVGLVDARPNGTSIRNQLAAVGVDVSRLAISERPVIAMGDQIDVAGLFAMDAVVIAVSDFRLHRFLVDLPVHTAPNARLIGLLSHLASNPSPEALEITLLHDLVIATAPDIQALVQSEAPIEELQRRMIGSTLRSAAIFNPGGCSSIVTKSERFEGRAADFDRFVAAVSIAFARRNPWCEAFDRVDPP